MNRLQKNDRASCKDLKEKILDEGLCCGCGACVGVCPTGALAINSDKSYTPVIDESKCKPCGLCLHVCPGTGYPVIEWSQRSCDNKTIMHSERGPVRHYWKGHSTEAEIRSGAATGGLATALLLYLLESGRVEEVVVVNMENGQPVVRMTADPDLVRAAKMSKYRPVPVMSVIEELRRRPRKIAMTVLPCQMAAWIRATEKFKKLRECLVLSIGLYCGQVKENAALETIAASVGLKYPDEANFVGWRCGDYPGSVRFELPDGRFVDKFIYEGYDIAVPHFSLNRCSLCPDGGNWLADMSLADDHSGGQRQTLTLCRTKQGEEIIRAAQEAGFLEFVEMKPEEVMKSTIHAISRSKILPAISVNAWMLKRGRSHPFFDYDEDLLMSGLVAKYRPFWIWKYRMTMWVRRGWQRKFLLAHPRLMQRVGHFLYYFPATIFGFSFGIKLYKAGRNLAKVIMGKGNDKSRA